MARPRYALSRFMICALLAVGVVYAATPDDPDVNPALIGHCCAPGRCNTDTTPTHTDMHLFLLTM